ncbi:MAG: hypothetical protein ACHQ53_12450 [Polyangiales bacterium]
MSSWAYVRVFSLIFGLGLVLLGCSSSARNGSGCVAGQNFACSCATGVQGVQTCGADNALGACSCTPASLVNGTGGSSPVQSGTPGAGGSSPAGTGGTTPPAGGPAGAGGGGPAGTGMGPGMGGMGGMMMMPGGGGGRAPAGSPYAFCMTNAECTSTNASCATTTRPNGMITGYCTQGCLLRACPTPPSGSVTVSCVVGQCALGSCQNADCPEGMNCVQSRTLGQQTFTCEYPSK